MTTKHPFTSEEQQALYDVIDLALLMISDDGRIEPGNEDGEKAISIVRSMLPPREGDQ